MLSLPMSPIPLMLRYAPLHLSYSPLLWSKWSWKWDQRTRLSQLCLPCCSCRLSVSGLTSFAFAVQCVLIFCFPSRLYYLLRWPVPNTEISPHWWKWCNVTQYLRVRRLYNRLDAFFGPCSTVEHQQVDLLHDANPGADQHPRVPDCRAGRRWARRDAWAVRKNIPTNEKPRRGGANSPHWWEYW